MSKKIGMCSGCGFGASKTILYRGEEYCRDCADFMGINEDEEETEDIEESGPETESLLFAKDAHHSGVILAFHGERINNEIEGNGTYIGDHFRPEWLPVGAGLFVWEGKIHYTSSDGGYVDDVDWEGAFRPATLADLTTFGIELAEVTA